VNELAQRELAQQICRFLLGMVAAIRTAYNLPNERGVTLEIKDLGDAETRTDNLK